MIIVKFLYTLALLIGITSSTFSQQMNEYGKLIEYSNKSKMSMKLDGQIIQDKDFTLKIPSVPRTELHSTSSDFFHVLEFYKGQKIAIIYNPNAETIDISSQLELSYSEFEKLCEKADLLGRLEKVVKFKKNRYFGFRKLNGIAFYILYLNIDRRNLDVFNYAINSIQL